MGCSRVSEANEGAGEPCLRVAQSFTQPPTEGTPLSTSPDHLWYSLLKHLGISHVLHVWSPKGGPWVREHHLYVNSPLMEDVLSFVVRSNFDEPIRVFEGPPPPF